MNITRECKRMANLKYKKYILTDLRLPGKIQEKEATYNRWAKHLLWLDHHVIEGAPFVNTAWYFNPEPEDILATIAPHTHPFDEVVGFFGSDPQNPYDLGGEIVFRLEDERYILKNSCLIFIPKGLRHSGEIIKVGTPIFHVSLGGVVQYSRNT
jgi:hypothetical protein